MGLAYVVLVPRYCTVRDSGIYPQVLKLTPYQSMQPWIDTIWQVSKKQILSSTCQYGTDHRCVLRCSTGFSHRMLSSRIPLRREVLFLRHSYPPPPAHTHSRVPKMHAVKCFMEMHSLVGGPIERVHGRRMKSSI